MGKCVYVGMQKNWIGKPGARGGIAKPKLDVDVGMWKMRKCVNGEMRKCGDVLMSSCGDVGMWGCGKCANVQMCKCVYVRMQKNRIGKPKLGVDV